MSRLVLLTPAPVSLWKNKRVTQFLTLGGHIHLRWLRLLLAADVAPITNVKTTEDMAGVHQPLLMLGVQFILVQLIIAAYAEYFFNLILTFNPFLRHWFLIQKHHSWQTLIFLFTHTTTSHKGCHAISEPAGEARLYPNDCDFPLVATCQLSSQPKRKLAELPGNCAEIGVRWDPVR